MALARGKAFSSTRYTSGRPAAPIQAKSTSAGMGTYSAELEGNAKNAINLEFIHNNLHNFIGGTQFLRPPKENIHLWGASHMSSVFMAAFDPIFFIYHNSIDRLTAMWQMLNWDKWFDNIYSNPTKNNDLTPFHKDANYNFWKPDHVRDWRALGYEYEILQGRTHDGLDDQKKLLEDIAKLYGNPTKNLFDGLPRDHGYDDDFVITVIYDKYALNGAPYKINLFLDVDDTTVSEPQGRVNQNFRGPESEGFVASIYNFSGSLDSGACGYCQQQKEEGVICIAQVPATVPMRHYLKRTNRRHEQALQPVYLALNSLGNPVQMDIHVELHRSWRPYYKNPFEPIEGDPLKYDFLKHGRQADEVFARTYFR